MEIKKQKDLQTAYFLFRLTMGFNFLLHGVVRIPKLSSFSSWMAGLFSESILPVILIKPFAYTLPFLELFIGLCLILGLKTPRALQGGALIILILISGSCLIEKWDMAGGQMLYAIFFFMLSYTIDLNKISLDYYFKK